MSTLKAFFALVTCFFMSQTVFGQEVTKRIVQNSDGNYSIVTIADEQPIDFGNLRGSDFTVEELSTMLSGEFVKKQHRTSKPTFNLNFPFFWSKVTVKETKFSLNENKIFSFENSPKYSMEGFLLISVLFLALFGLGITFLIIAKKWWKSRATLFWTGASLVIPLVVVAVSPSSWGWVMFIVMAIFSMIFSKINHTDRYGWYDNDGMFRAIAIGVPMTLVDDGSNTRRLLAICLILLISIVWGIMLALSWKRLKAKEACD